MLGELIVYPLEGDAGDAAVMSMERCRAGEACDHLGGTASGAGNIGVDVEMSIDKAETRGIVQGLPEIGVAQREPSAQRRLDRAAEFAARLDGAAEEAAAQPLQ